MLGGFLIAVEALPQIEGGTDGLQTGRVAPRVLNKQLQTADKGRC